MASFTVVYDACVLYPASVRALVIELARTGLMHAKWTEQIHNEWINAICRQRPELDRSRLERTAQLMNAAVLDCLVSGFESLETGLTELPTPMIDTCSRRPFIAGPRRLLPSINVISLRESFGPMGFEPFIPTSSSSIFWI